MEVHDPPIHTSPAGLIEFLSFQSATGSQKPNFRVAHGSGVDDDKRVYEDLCCCPFANP
jgi:hypothetical protein